MVSLRDAQWNRLRNVWAAEHHAMNEPSPSRYQLLHKLAAGGMATVHVGRARGLAGFERLVAVKCCHPHLREEPEFVSMFLDEARLAAKIHHPNVIATLDVGEDDALYLVMDYIEGDRLSEIVRAANARGENVPVPIVLRILLDVLAGLHAAHELVDARGERLEIVHRDISPQNVMVGADGVTRIMDFGIAKAASCASVTRTGQLKGRLGYMAPEQLARREVTRSIDVYAAGVVLWETLTGQRLFRGETEGETANLVLRCVVPRLSDTRPGLPAALDAVVARAITRDPRNRFPTALAFAEAIEASGLDVAPTRAVANYVRDVRGESLDARRAWIRELVLNANDTNASPVGEADAKSTGTVTFAAPPDEDASATRRDVHRPRRFIAFLVVALVCTLPLLSIGIHNARRRSIATVRANSTALAAESAAPSLPSPAAPPQVDPTEHAAPSPAALDAAAITDPSVPTSVAHANSRSRSTHRARNSERRASHRHPHGVFSPNGL